MMNLTVKAAACLLIVSLFFISCTDNDEKAADAAVTTPDSVVAEEPEDASVVSQLPLWQNFLEQQFPQLEAEDFIPAYTIPLETFPAYPIQDDNLKYLKPYFAYNHDSTRAIDIYSYSSVLRKNGDQVVMMNGEPDAQINLVDVKANTTQRIFFSGPSLTLWDAQWIDTNKVIVAGTEEQMPVYWIVDLKLRNMQLFMMEGAELEPSMTREHYLRRKMKGVLIPG